MSYQHPEGHIGHTGDASCQRKDCRGKMCIPAMEAMKKPSEIFEGENSSLKKTFDEATVSEEPEESKMKCESCGKEKPDVSVRACGFSQEINGTTVMEQICDECEHEHLMDI